MVNRQLNGGTDSFSTCITSLASLPRSISLDLSEKGSILDPLDDTVTVTHIVLNCVEVVLGGQVQSCCLLVVFFAPRNYIQTAFAPTIARGGDINDAMRIPRCQNRQREEA